MGDVVLFIYRLVDDRLVSVCKCTDNKNTKQGIGEKSEKKWNFCKKKFDRRGKWAYT